MPAAHLRAFDLPPPAAPAFSTPAAQTADPIGGAATLRSLLPDGHHGLHRVLGEEAWRRLSPAVRARFGEPVIATDYVGTFEIVRASALGRFIALICRLIGTPVVPRVGVNVPSIVHV